MVLKHSVIKGLSHVRLYRIWCAGDVSLGSHMYCSIWIGNGKHFTKNNNHKKNPKKQQHTNLSLANKRTSQAYVKWEPSRIYN